MRSVILILLMPLTTLSQTLMLSGKVTDQETKEPLMYASVSLKGKSSGTITNGDGAFDFYISIHNKKDTLLISMLGYSDYQVLVGDLKNTDALNIGLHTNPVLLGETVIASTKMTGREILINAFEKVEKNFPMKPYLMKTFFRELYEEDGKAVFVVDAVAGIGDDGYKLIKNNRRVLRERVHAENVRASHKGFKSIFDPNNFSYLTYSLLWRTVKYRDPKMKDLVNKYHYELDSIIYSGNDLLYRITYSADTLHEHITDSYYIDSKTYAIKKHVYEDLSTPELTENKWQFKTDTNYWYRTWKRSVTQEYENFEGKMYLKYVSGEFEAEIYTTTTNKAEHTLKTNELLLVTDIETHDFNKISRKENVKPWLLLTYYMKPYDAQFWNNYEQAKLFPLTRKQVKDLEKDMPLEEQYRRIDNETSLIKK